MDKLIDSGEMICILQFFDILKGNYEEIWLVFISIKKVNKNI